MFVSCFLIAATFRPAPGDSIAERLAQYVSTYWQEKVYLHFDKPYYSSGETLWYQSYLVNAVTHRPGGRSSLLYVELLDPNNEVVEQHRLRVEDGTASNSFVLPDSLPSGNYRVRAYTNWMRNFDEAYFFDQTFPVWATDSTAIGQTLQQELETEEETFVYEGQRSLVDLQFFPEGGELVDGLASLVAFKAVGPDGKHINVRGTIVDERQQEVAQFETHRLGMGAFILKPTAGEFYTAQVDLQGVALEFSLPPVQPQGYALRVIHHPQRDQVKVTVYSNQPDLPVTGGQVIAHRRGEVFAAFTVEKDQPYLVVDLERSLFPPGICHFTFFDANGVPQCERLLYVNLSKAPQTTLQTAAPFYGQRDSVAMQLTLRDTSGQAVAGLASLTVTNPRQITYDPYAEDIRSNLLLTSELKGFVEQPSYYLEDTSAEAYRARDYLMLTQGWRRFRWEDVLRDSVPELSHVLERGFTVSGRLVKFYNRNQPDNGAVEIMVMPPNFYYAKGETGDNGRFAFVGNQFDDSTEVVVQARRMVGKNNELRQDVTIELDAFRKPPLAPQARPQLTPTLARMTDYLNQRRRIDQVDAAYNFDEQTIVLEGVEVRGRRNRQQDPFYRADALYKNPSNRLVVDSMPGAAGALNVFDLLRQVPGVRVLGTIPNQTAVLWGASSIPGSGRPLFLLDGIPVDAALINSLNVKDVYFVDVLKGPSAAIYGNRGANGAIAVYTRRGSSDVANDERQGIVSFTHPGYSPVREFYAPRYGTQKPEHVKPDIRSTLFWEPDIVFDQEGKATVSFYTSDQLGTYEMYLEGITAQGEPVVGKASFVVKNK
ncbi:MAG: TonB-dependent receptor plug domain-containing protein [Tunicatimonas sp.]